MLLASWILGSNHSQSLMDSNFAALWSTDPKFLAVKDLNPFSTMYKVQEDSRILRMGFDLSKWPHLLHKMSFVDSLTHTTVHQNPCANTYSRYFSNSNTSFSCKSTFQQWVNLSKKWPTFYILSYKKFKVKIDCIAFSSLFKIEF